jgi:hypothetical protein
VVDLVGHTVQLLDSRLLFPISHCPLCMIAVVGHCGQARAQGWSFGIVLTPSGRHR